MVTNKERLSYFEKQYAEEKDVAKYAGITVTGDEFKWLIEQAERAQELEEDYEYLSHHYGLETEQNKRYREAINKAIESCCYDAAITDLRKFMESDEG